MLFPRVLNPGHDERPCQRRLRMKTHLGKRLNTVRDSP